MKSVIGMLFCKISFTLWHFLNDDQLIYQSISSSIFTFLVMRKFHICTRLGLWYCWDLFRLIRTNYTLILYSLFTVVLSPCSAHKLLPSESHHSVTLVSYYITQVWYISLREICVSLEVFSMSLSPVTNRVSFTPWHSTLFWYIDKIVWHMHLVSSSFPPW